MKEHGNVRVKTSRLEHLVKTAYRRFIFPCVKLPLHRQRLKLLWFIWQYWPILALKNISCADRMKLLARFVRIDWYVVHGHLSSEIAHVCTELASRKARSNEVVIEAGCWNGGSAAKFSIICNMLGYRLMIYDSFAGVETPPLDQQGRENKSFFGEYSAPEVLVRDNLKRYGESEVCQIVKGWFKDTLAKAPVPYPVRLGYVDCDLVKGTEEALSGMIPSLADDGCIFSEDYHIKPVHNMLRDTKNLERFSKRPIVLTALGPKLAVIKFKDGHPKLARV